MSKASQKVCLVEIALSLASSFWCDAEQSFSHEEGHARWMELQVPEEGKTGFTELSADKTGIQFTNILDEWSGAANRVLEDGSGVAIGDIDGDGRPDIFLCSLQGRNALYRNLGGWRFEEVTVRAGIDATNYVCRGAVFADIDGDGRLDLLISTLGHGVLCFINNGKGGFMNVTKAAGTETQFGSTTMALADIDGDGTLDLYVANYRISDIRDRARIPVQYVNGRAVFPPELQDRLLLVKEGLIEFGEPDVLYRNDGKGHFISVSWAGGKFLDDTGGPLSRPPMDWGLSAAFHDIDGDGAPDLFVCNDYWTPDRLWLNDGKGVFRAAPRLAVRHTSENSMGVDFADIDRDGHMDFIVLDMLSRSSILRKTQLRAQTRLAQTTAIGEITDRPQIMRNTLFHNRGDGTFEELADLCGVSASDWSWQPVFVDVDLDGYEDLIISAGHRRDVQDLDANTKISSLQHRWPKDIDPKAHQEAFTREMMEHVGLYPHLERPIVAFRNRGNLTFEEMTDSWGTSRLGVHQGIAFGDLDGDGDLDFVVNNLNGPAGVYRNESKAPRVAVRLKGIAPNTRGIGAMISLHGGVVPMQSQEMICGGRYLSGDDAMRVFAAGTLTNEMRIEVKWRNGKRTVVQNVRANRLYEIDEAASEPHKPSPKPELKPFFEYVSQLLNHKHHDEEFNDFELQPLLPKKLSQLGPGVAWMDVDGDGKEDLIIGTGKGGVMAVFRNDGPAGFQKLAVSEQPTTRDQTGILASTFPSGKTAILVGSANYEDRKRTGEAVNRYEIGLKNPEQVIPDWNVSVGPLALASLDGGPNLSLFIGGRVVPGRYPEPASSRLFLLEDGKFKLSQEFKELGMVSSAVWSDLNGDGYPDLILACEWGPVRVFHNDKDKLREVTGELGLEQYTGWWNGVTTGDLDGDGRMDIIASNWGRNTKYERYRKEPLRIYYGDFNGENKVQILESFYAPELKKYVPWQPLNPASAAMPWLHVGFATHAAYASAGVAEILGPKTNAARHWEARTLESMVFLNRGDHFEARPLPVEAQFAPAFGVCVGDYDGDAREDVFLAQNFFAVDPDTPRYDAGQGLWLRGDGTGRLTPVPSQESGVKVYGEQRGCALCDYDGDGRIDLVVTQNGTETKLFHNMQGKPGLRVRLKGPLGNPLGIGAQLRLKFGTKLGPMREIHGGSGYWSHDSVVQVLGAPEPPTEIWIRWPGGKVTTNPIPMNAREISVDPAGKLETLQLR